MSTALIDIIMKDREFVKKKIYFLDFLLKGSLGIRLISTHGLRSPAPNSVG